MLLAAGAWTGTGGDEIDVELVGFLVGLPEAGLRLPVPDAATVRLEVPNPQGGARVAFTVEFTARTQVALTGGRARDGQVVVLEGMLHRDQIQARRVREVDVVELTGRLSLPGGPLTLPVTADRVVEVFLDGAPGLPVAFLLTPRTMSGRRSLRHGAPVTLAVVSGLRIVVGIEESD